MLQYFKSKKNKTTKDAREVGEGAPSSLAEVKRDGDAVPPAESSKHSKPGEDQTSISSDERPAHERPVLDRSDESFLQSILSDDSPPPPLPKRVPLPDIEWPSDDMSSSDVRGDGDVKAKVTETGGDEGKETDGERVTEKDEDKGKAQEAHKPNRLSLLFHKHKKDDEKSRPKPKTKTKTKSKDASPSSEEEQREEKDVTSMIDRLKLASKNNKVISFSDESADLLQKFTQIFKDLANGVPTAYDDLNRLFKDRDGAITRGFEKLPSSLQKLVTQLPSKLTASIAPEVLAAAAKSQGLEAAEHLFTPQNLLELATKPGAIVGMLRAIVTALKTRWPAFLGVNVLWSVALFLLMFVLWYCHKRGREVRLGQEKAGAEASEEAGDRVEELPDDPALPAPQPGATRALDSRLNGGTPSTAAHSTPAVQASASSARG